MLNCLGLFNMLYNKIIIKYYRIRCGKELRISGRILVKGERGRIELGDSVTINSRERDVPIGFNVKSVFWVMNNGRISIGNQVGMSNVSVCCQTKVEIGNYVLLGGGVKIYDTDFHSLDFQKRVRFKTDDDRKSSPVTIKNYASIGAGTIVLKGVTIGEKSIIGAGSVVTSNIPDGQIWAGNPARYIKNVPM